jgi:para-nitrobenzyl esterase
MEDVATDRYGKRADEFLAAFPGTSDDDAIQSADAFTTAQFIALGTWTWIEAQVKTGKAPVYRYRFDLAAPPSEVHPEGKYAFHSDELEYVFGTLDTRHGAQWRPQDYAFSDEMTRYWANLHGKAIRTVNDYRPGLVTTRRNGCCTWTRRSR